MRDCLFTQPLNLLGPLARLMAFEDHGGGLEAPRVALWQLLRCRLTRFVRRPPLQPDSRPTEPAV